MPRFSNPVLEDATLLGTIKDDAGRVLLRGAAGLAWRFVDGGYNALTTGVTAQLLPVHRPPVVGDVVIAGYAVSDDADQLQNVVAALDRVSLKVVDPLAAHAANWAIARQVRNAPDELGVVAAGICPVIATTDVAQDITLAGVLATDIVIAQLHTALTGGGTLNKCIAAAGKITATFSADPTGGRINYVVLRPLSAGFTPSHRIFAAEDSVICPTAAGTTQSVTVAGALATDVAIVHFSTTDDTDTITTVKAAAGALTVIVSANPLTAHYFGYVVLRATA